MKKGKQKLLWNLLLIFTLVSTLSMAQNVERHTLSDTIKILKVATAPTMDGINNEMCWDSTGWVRLDQYWIPYNSSIDSSDFYGRFKTLWSDVENLLYFLVEITDDVFIDGYVYNSSPGTGGGYPNFDVVEVFIDENNSGGKHVFDGVGQTGAEWGYNGENAFSYHINLNAPDEGETVSDFYACDIAGTSWADEIIADYADHFNSLVMRKTGNVYTYEFSLKVFNDSYNDTNKEASRVDLATGKIMGLSMAYCENDQQDNSRDNFIGSVWVPQANNNDHWMNADFFGNSILVDQAQMFSVGKISSSNRNSLFPNPAKNYVHIEFQTAQKEDITINIYNITGNLIFSETKKNISKDFHDRVDVRNLKSGIYFLEMNAGNERFHQKFIKE